MFDELFAKGGLSLERIRTLVEIVEAGSIARAAKGDPVRQSLYSRQLKELETFVGVKLTFRRGRALSINPEGLLLASLGRESLKSLEHFLQRLKHDAAIYTVAGGELYLQTVLIPKLGAIKAAIKKETKLEIAFVCQNKRSRDVIDGLTNARFDFGLLTHLDDLPPALSATPLFSFEHRLYVPRPLMPKTKNLLAEDLLLSLPVATQEQESTYTRSIQKLYKEREVFKPGLICTSVPQLISAVKSGAFAAVLPSFTTSHFSKSHVQEVLFSKGTILHQTLHLAWNPRQETIRTEMRPLRETLIGLLKPWYAEVAKE